MLASSKSLCHLWHTSGTVLSLQQRKEPLYGTNNIF
jgi:hypothetical protein